MGFILSYISYRLLFIIAVLNFIVVMYKNINTYGFWKAMNKFWFDNALELDIWANYHFRTLWNTILRKVGGYSFGVIGETISSALGKNQRDKTLSIPGWVLVYILWAIDIKFWLKGGHCINSIK